FVSADGGDAKATFINVASINVKADADASTGTQYAVANADANGVGQSGVGGKVNEAITHQGLFLVRANAHALKTGINTIHEVGASANATAGGFGQFISASDVTGKAFIDNNVLGVKAIAAATGADGARAGAYATGIYQQFKTDFESVQNYGAPD